MKFILLFSILILSSELHGQIEFHLDTYKKNQIFSETITSLAIDSFGYLWVGTRNGVMRYDGSNIDKYQNEGKEGNALQGNYVYDILPQNSNSLWISTYGGGISMYSYKNNDFETLLTSSSENAIKENRVVGMYSLSEDSILVHYRGIDFESGGFSLIDSEGTIIGHFMDEFMQADGYFFRFLDLVVSGQSIWIPAQKLYQFDKSTLSFTAFEFPFSATKWDDAKAIAAYSDSTLLVGSNSGLYSYYMNRNEWTTVLPNVYVKALKEYGDNIYIMCSSEIYIFHNATGKTSVFMDAGKISQVEDFRFNALELSDNRLWIATSMGLFKFDLGDQIVQVQRVESNPPTELRSVKSIGFIPKSKNEMLIDYSGKILKKTEPKKVTAINKVGNRVHETITDFLQKDNYLFASDDGLFEYDAINNQVTSFIDNTSLESILKGEDIWSIYNNRIDSILWIGTRSKGLIKYDVGKDTFINFRHDPANPNSLCFDRYLFKIAPGLDGNLWISTDRGLSVIDPKSNTFVLYPKIMNLLSDYIVHHNVAGGRYMWIGTRDHGLFRYDIKNDEVKTYTTRQGLPYTGANRLIFDQGILFFSTRKGVCILNESTDKIILFDESNGIDHEDLYHSKLNMDDEYLNISGGISNKIYQIPRTNFTKEKDLNPILIESVKTNTSDTSLVYYYPKSSLNLTAEEDNITVTFTNIEFDRRKINYRYKLEPYDQLWTESSEVNFANYSHLPGDKYQFFVQSSIAGRSWEQEAVLNIQIDKFWYHTWWFYTLCIIGLIGTFGLLLKISFDKINLKKSYQLMLSNAELKALRAQMNPHFVFNSLNSIKSFIIENDRRNATDYLNKFSKLMRLILNHSKSNAIPLSEEIQAIQLYIDMERLRFNSFDFTVDMDEQIDTGDILVPPMIIQPYLENAIWHGLQHKTSGNGKLYLRFKMQEDALHVSIRDNGVGRAEAAALKSKSALGKKSLGMNITKERLHLSQLNQGTESVKIIDLFEAGKATGTEIQLILPYTKSEFYEK